ncbi:MAG TPA: transglutaminase domain-containing protein, partial [Longimicrobium sp.]|uniref:transglutaminase domain-containing protein n=1 Tax=Longimicrobium sp. TaxID=2029185 RepID=UPI002EDA7532
MTILRIAGALAAAALLAAAPVSAQRPQPDYRLADSVALAAPSTAASVQEIAARVTAGLQTDRDKARAIYRWITHNIEYDAAAFYGSRLAVPVQTPPAVLRRKRAVCDGFAFLYMAMAHAAGLEAGVVEGFAKAATGDPRNPVSRQRHAWNVVRIDGAWQPVDASWGAGDVVGRGFVRRFRDFYFFPDPEKFIYSHMAADPVLQGLEHPVSVSEFDRMPTLQRDFWELGFTPADVRGASGQEFVGVFPVARHPI